MPKSRIRKKDDYTPPSSSTARQATSISLHAGGGRWVAPLMLALFLIGLAWIVLFYVTETKLPIESIGNWNIVVGFGFIAAGFVVSTQWK
ncbi:cell division protein CrgA [Streptomyces pactum]|uniref:Cell division protein CrgA n=1 Tax=Streptomyces pactum TaxID=68249 RepID=A0ABS0NLB5_9ACTN|nr:cell division protein CrgA [Streptomyces pactum]MBH5335979.1 cell division protein CrgA [Streptomyces pactum]